MASWRSVRPGNQFLTLKLVGSKTVKDILADVKPGEYKGKAQLVGRLKKDGRSVAINTTSCELLEKAWGEDFDNWIGKKVSVKRAKNNFDVGGEFLLLISPDGK